MDEFLASDWLLFDIDEPRYGLFLNFIVSTARHLTNDPYDQTDIINEMWKACLEIRLDPPKDYPVDPRTQDNYCKVAMHHAALRCLLRDLPDGPVIRPHGYVDPERIPVSLPEE